MKTLGFIACSYFLMTSNNAAAARLDEITNFPGSSIQIRTQCHESGGSLNCAVYASGKNKEKKIIDFPKAPAYISMISEVFIISFPCGTQCSATYFYSEVKGLGGPFPLVGAYDVNRGVVLLISRNPLPMYSIFSKEGRVIGEVKLNISEETDVVSAIKEAAAEGHQFVITYVDRDGNVMTIRRQVPKLTGAPSR